MFLRLDVGDIISVVEGDYEIKNIMPDGKLLLLKQFGHDSLFMTQSELLKRYADRLLKIVRREDRRRVRIDTFRKTTARDPNIDPDPRARIRQLLLVEYDKSPVARSDKSLNAFIRNFDLPKDLDDANYRPSAGTLRRDIRNRIENGHRPIHIMSYKSSRSTSTRMDESSVRLLLKCVDWFYEKRERRVADAYDRLRSLVDYLNLRARRYGRYSGLKCPSHETVRYWIRRCENFALCKKKYGEKAARRRFQGSSSAREAKRPLDVVMIDATTLDAFVIVDNDSGNVLGRPTLMAAIDVCTRMILAIFITFEPPSIYAVMNCIKGILTPKEGIIAQKFPDLREPFVAFGLLRLIVLDNALENVGSSLQDALRDLSIDVEWAPVKSPEFKVHIERFFGTLNTGLLHRLPGGVPAPPKELREQDIDPRKQACMTIDRLEELVLQFILEVYQYRYHRGINDIPIRLWEKLTKIHGIDVLDDLTRIDDACGYVKKANLTRDGVKVEGLRFHDRNTVTELLADLLPLSPRGRRRKPSNSVPVKIKFDPEDISKIRVWNSHTLTYQELPNVEQHYSKGMSLWFHRVLRKRAKQEQEEFVSESDRVRARVRLTRSVENAGATDKLRRARIVTQIESLSSLDVQHAPPRHDGKAPVVSTAPGMENRADGGEMPAGFLRGRAKRKVNTNKHRKSVGSRSKKETISAPSTGLELKDPSSFMTYIGKAEGWDERD
ncbi:MAG: DDE-type integrase/transposase/recombinase [Parvibaculaceae bacterium]|nr:DDE-type integrase/transposase/recombinase [Parvibaculaceae bacterium]